ncbi:hypothetical protein IW140_003148 [Coemansia sp. RSA 1813]|nr:hypothetical protein LPJ74_000007 [Coemansia sp. RSA 1843]KAJ2214475.1 hypothetical protein EV179_003018 [Coemansia sp. RSA 487]KAJ2569303.1 hypothetical protein IW140_003148 [Coemansia sp. RSA 1813]
MGDSRVEEYAAKCGLRIVADAAKGHRTVAARRFARGQTILSINPLYGFPVRATETTSAGDTGQHASVDPEARCAHCFHTLPARYPQCSQCHSTQYCSTGCLTAHWAVRHHFECTATDAKAIDAAAAKVKPEYRPYLRMAAGVGATLSAKQRPWWLKIQAAAWERLVSHRNAHPPHVLRQYAQIAAVLSEAGVMQGYTKDQGSQADAIVTALCRFGCNNFAAYDYSAHAVTGHLCSPVVSLLFNHSCFPNASFVYSTADGCQVVHALGEIAEGDEVTLAYVDGMHPRTVRQKTLSDVYFFACACTRCEGASERGKIDSLLDRDAAGALPINLPTDYAKHKPKLDPWAVAIVSELCQLASSAEPNKDSHRFDQNMLDAVNSELPRDVSFAAYKHWLECQDECLEKVSDGHPEELWPWACVSSLYVLAFYAMAYPLHHPLVGTQCLEAAKITWNSMQVSNTTPADGVDESLVKRLVLATQTILEVSASPDASSSGAMSLTRQIALLLDQLSSD